MENEKLIKQVKHLKLWVAACSIGFLLIGISAITFSITTASVMSEFDDEWSGDCGEEESFSDKASDYFKVGKIDQLNKLIEERIKTHPNDSNIYWYSTRVHVLNEEWELAIEDLNQTKFLSPSWDEEYIKPMREEILRRKNETNTSL